MNKFTKNKIVRVIMLIVLGLFILSIDGYSRNTTSTITYTQLKSKRVSIDVKNESISNVLRIIQKQSGISFVINPNDVPEKLEKITIKLDGATVAEAIETVLSGTDLTYMLADNYVSIVKKANEPTIQQEEAKYVLRGKVVDENDKPIIGAVVIDLSDSGNGSISDDEGIFVINVTKGSKIEISHLGHESVIVTMEGEDQSRVIKMKSQTTDIENVVVTGYFTRNKDSFTGSASTFSAKQLQSVGGSNVLESLSILDPAFVMFDNKLRGSDPNSLPDIQMRGVSGLPGLESEFSADPNMPLFILDGFEASLEIIMDLNPDRVSSITLLKDAASVAIYGSKAANGVVVVETVKPQPGNLRVSYSGRLVIDSPDLSDYNLMNSAEKLEFERLAGVFTASASNLSQQLALDNIYNERLREVMSGVDSYWLSEPLRTAVNHNHNINIDGGDSKVRYSVGLSYGDNSGVMKGSGRETMSGSFNLSYRAKDILFSNIFSTSITNTQYEQVSFSEYSKMNPSLRKYDDNNNLIEEYNIPGAGNIYNPMYLEQQPYERDGVSRNFRNSFNAEWSITNDLRLRGRLGISWNQSDNTEFKSPNHVDFDNVNQSLRGTYSYGTAQSYSYDGDVSLTYGKTVNNHIFNVVGGWTFNESRSTSTGYSVRGFVSDDHNNPSFAGSYSSNLPSYSEAIARSTSFFGNGNYSYDNRYSMDLSLRADATSLFGLDKLFDLTWAFGLAWNLDREKFIDDLNLFQVLRIRGSIGNPGNQNFDPYIAQNVYRYNSEYQTIFGPTVIIEDYGNSSLEWQRALDRNIGIDFQMVDSKVKFSFDAYSKRVDPLVVTVPLPTSTGATAAYSNLGGLNTSGFNGTFSVNLLNRKDIIWNANFSIALERDEYFGISDYLSSTNQELSDLADLSERDFDISMFRDTDILNRYYDGASTSDLYAVRSLGIDPTTGMEIYLDEYGNPTFEYNRAAEVIVGNSRPKFHGVIGSSFVYKKFDVNVYFRYSYGAHILASALYSKVENITTSDLTDNLDKRALYDRWQQPGDVAQFASIDASLANASVPMSSRFVLEESYLSLESLNVNYRLESQWLKNNGVNGVSVGFYTNNLFRLSTVKEERGLDYPFARSYTLNFRFTF